jgi:glutamyl-Q tRNA(Asp) synthetase
LHLGSLYTALASFLEAKAHGGEWLLRIDDVDTPRVAAGASDSILRTLERFGLDWDGPVVYQSQHFADYQAALDRLDQAGLLYPCICSRKTLAALPRVAERTPYPGFCRHVQYSRDLPHALRVLVGDTVIQFDDKLQGPQYWDLKQVFGDFIVFRRDTIFAYHLATVIDDATAGVSEVLRGYDLLDSTPLQIHLQNLLGLPTPNYRHIPVLVDSNGTKLSKQNLAEAVDRYEVAATLVSILRLFGLVLPLDLRNAPVAEILTWAIAHWDVNQLTGIRIVAPVGW